MINTVIKTTCNVSHTFLNLLQATLKYCGGGHMCPMDFEFNMCSRHTGIIQVVKLVVIYSTLFLFTQFQILGLFSLLFNIYLAALVTHYRYNKDFSQWIIKPFSKCSSFMKIKTVVSFLSNHLIGKIQFRCLRDFNSSRKYIFPLLD